MHVTPANQVTAGPQELVLLLARRGTAVTDCGRRPLAYAPPASGSEFAPSGALVGCARSERPSRSRLRSDEARVPDDRDPFEASVRRGWREPSKRSSASVGADAPFRGKGIARPEQPREPKQSWRARSATPGFEPLRQRARFAGRPIPSKHNHVCVGTGRSEGPLRPRSPGCRLARRSGHLVRAGTRAAPFRPIQQRRGHRRRWLLRQRERQRGCACKPPRIGPPASTSETPATAAKQVRRPVAHDAGVAGEPTGCANGDKHVAHEGRDDTCLRARAGIRL